jgi:O-antigen ligase
MLDALLFVYTLALLAFGLRRPFVWVLAYLYLDIVAPQKIGWTLMPALPFSLIAFVAAFAGWLFIDSKEGSRFTFRQGLMVLLLVYVTMTASWAQFPEFAWEKWGWVWKALIFACLLIPVGTEARTGLLCIGVLAVLLLRSVKRRFVYMALGALALTASVPFLPQSFLERMGTIENHDEDESASTRVAVWKWTLDYVKEHPLGGGFEAYRANSFSYKRKFEVGDGNSTAIETVKVEDKGRAFHSSYFEMLGEQGWPGLALWLWLQGLGVWQMERLRRRYLKRAKEDPQPGEEWKAALANALQQAQVVYLVGALFVGIAYQPFILMLIGLQCALWSYLRRIDAPANKWKKPLALAAEPPPAGQAPALH